MRNEITVPFELFERLVNLWEQYHDSIPEEAKKLIEERKATTNLENISG